MGMWYIENCIASSPDEFDFDDNMFLDHADIGIQTVIQCHFGGAVEWLKTEQKEYAVDQ